MADTTPQQHANTLIQMIGLSTVLTAINSEPIRSALDAGAEALSRSCATCRDYSYGHHADYCHALESWLPPQPFSCSRFTAKE